MRVGPLLPNAHTEANSMRFRPDAHGRTPWLFYVKLDALLRNESDIVSVQYGTNILESSFEQPLGKRSKISI